MITKEPDIKGITGTAWKAAVADDVRAKWPAGLDLWLMNVPGAHPVWSWYVVTACSLRDFPGVPPAHKKTERSTHEINVVALNPNGFKPSDGWCSDTEDRWAKWTMTPHNLDHQIEDFDDEMMNELVFLLVRAFCCGHANPDDDFRATNRAIVTTTADHLRRGLHRTS